MTDNILSIEEWRAKYVVWCPSCREDTLPLRDGRCGFCDAKIAEPDKKQSGSAPRPADGDCLWCGAHLPPPRQRKYCNQACKQAYWLRFTERGQAWNSRAKAKDAA